MGFRLEFRFPTDSFFVLKCTSFVEDAGFLLIVGAKEFDLRFDAISAEALVTRCMGDDREIRVESLLCKEDVSSPDLSGERLAQS